MSIGLFKIIIPSETAPEICLTQQITGKSGSFLSFNDDILSADALLMIIICASGAILGGFLE